MTNMTVISRIEFPIIVCFAPYETTALNRIHDMQEFFFSFFIYTLYTLTLVLSL